ncbi:MAG: response regulator [Verrucomicrobiota bacterium]
MLPLTDSATLAPFNPAGAKVLVVDDDRVNRRILHGILQTAGYVIAEAGSGEEALVLCEEFQPELVLLDVMLPGLDGFATCRELIKRHGKAAPPVIFITAKNASDDIVEGLEAGGVDYVPKPFRQNEVLARIRTHRRCAGWWPSSARSSPSSAAPTRPKTSSSAWPRTICGTRWRPSAA